jgi:phosphopantothenoylcysteine decarboxylase / phosphopantothenate---cysteine ligase
MKIILYVTGSISCYKSIDLTRYLVNDSHEVVVVLSKAAEHFLKKDIFSYLGAKTVYCADDDFSSPSENIRHIELSRWAEYFVVCPASANTISHLACGLTKDLGTTIFLALESTQQKLIFPAMNTKMLENHIIKKHLKSLAEIPSTTIFPTETGTLACGENGAGKLLEIEKIKMMISCWPKLKVNKKVLISTGASISPLDDVRYLTNPASGKTGLKIAEKFLRNGYDVCIITGLYSSDKFNAIQTHPNLNVIIAKTAEDYLSFTKSQIDTSDLFISAAAICDITFNYSMGKMKKDKLQNVLNISKSPDILKEVIKNKRRDQCFIGFAAEANLSKEVLKKKWESKKVDLLIGTEVNSGAGPDKETSGFISSEANYKFFEDQKISFSGKLNKAELSDIIFTKVQKWFI